METIGKLAGKRIKEVAELMTNRTGYFQPEVLFFVQLDNEYSVDSEGAIFQIVEFDYDLKDDDFELENEDFCKKHGYVPLLVYKGESGTYYNYAEDSDNFKEDSKDRKVYERLCEIAQQGLFS